MSRHLPAACGLPGKRKVLGNLPPPQSLNVPEFLVPISVGYVGILGFPFGQFEEVFFGDQAVLGAIPQVRPFFPGQPLPQKPGYSN